MARESEKNTLKPTKGKFKGHKWIIFDAIGDCTEEACALYELCPYEKNGRCSVEVKYTTAIFESFVEEVGDKLTRRILNSISLRLVPLFGQLVKMKKIALGIQDPTYTTAQGAIKIHPVFREIREIIKCIESTQRSMGLDNDYLGALGGFGSDIGDLKNANKDGDISYARELIKGEQERSKNVLFPDGLAQHPKREMRQ